MALPDISRLRSIPDPAWRALRERLRALGLTPDRIAPLIAAAQGLHPMLRRPLRAFHLRRLREPLGYAMRMLMFNDPVTPDEARAVFGKQVSALVEAGLLEPQDDGGVVSPFVLAVLDDLYILSDDLTRGGDAVMGFGESTIELCQAAAGARPLGSALDLGCGSGTVALALARSARRVVGTDINPRAIDLARLNAALNGVGNVELREGDLFGPTLGEAFDLVVSQPPFIPRPEGAGGAAFLYGGARGDELALALLAGLAPHLEAGGRALLRVDWPDDGKATVAHRIRAAIGADGLDLLLLQAPSISPDEHAAAYASGLHPALDAAFDAEAIRRREHLDRVGVRGVLPTFAVLQRTSSTAAWTHVLDVAPMKSITVTSDRIDKLLAACALAQTPERILEATLRMPAGTVLAQEQEGPGADVPSTISARFAGTALVQPIQMTTDLLFLFTFIHEAPSVRSGVAQFAAAQEVPFDKAMAEVLPSVARALVQGLLELHP